MAEEQINAACHAICKSGKFETGEGTCAFICMDQLGGDIRRKGCFHAERVHRKLAEAVVAALPNPSVEPSPFERELLEALKEAEGDILTLGDYVAEETRTTSRITAAAAFHAKIRAAITKANSRGKGE